MYSPFVRVGIQDEPQNLSSPVMFKTINDRPNRPRPTAGSKIDRFDDQMPHIVSELPETPTGESANGMPATANCV
jgi:hypothetical protein